MTTVYILVTLVENIAKKNCNHFPIAVLLTTLICSHLTIADQGGQKNRNGITTAVLFPWGVHWQKT
jgi:hypothetical protein